MIPTIDTNQHPAPDARERHYSEGLPRVLHVSPFPDELSGANRSMLTMVEEMAARGKVWVATVREGDLAEAARVLGARTHVAFEKMPRWRVIRAPGVIRTLIQVVRRQKIEILHCHSAIGNHYCKWVKRATGVTLVTHQRDNYASDYFHSDLGSADCIVSISQHVHRQLPAALQERSHVLWNPVRVPKMLDPEKKATEASCRPLRIGMAGRCVPEKGGDLFIDACLRLSRETDAEFHFWGLRDTPFGRDLVDRVGKTGECTIRRFHFEGFRNDMKAFFHLVDVVAVPSRFEEPMGRMAIEAMAAGLPVVAADHGGLSEIIEHEKTGLLVEPRSVDALLDALRRLSADSALRGRLASAGSAWVKEELSPIKYTDRLLRLYQAVSLNTRQLAPR